MDYKITRLDRRHACHGIMKYHVEITFNIWGKENRLAQFMEYRNWCWEMFGPGVERKWITVGPEDAGPNGQCQMVSKDRWAWHTEGDEMRLYFKSDAEMSFFTLKHAD